MIIIIYLKFFIILEKFEILTLTLYENIIINICMNISRVPLYIIYFYILNRKK